MSLPPYAVTYSGHPCCPCQAEWLPVLQTEAQRRGLIKGQLPISQLIGGAAESANTHLLGGASDFYPLGAISDVTAFVRLCRDMGADATWHRPIDWDGAGGVEHVHSVATGCPHCATTAAYQTTAVRGGFNGLGHAGQGAPDDGPKPLSGRTWKQGIEWAEEQAMADYAAQLEQIINGQEASKNRDVALRKLVKGVSDQVDALTDAVGTGDAEIKTRITKAKAEVKAAIAELDQVEA